MEVSIFILCYNESVLLPHTINYYRKKFPSCKITILDNESSDNSVNIALSLDCKVLSFSSNNIQHEGVQRYHRNNCWKEVEKGWIIMIDMDEWLSIDEKDLLYEFQQGTSILKFKGLEMLGESVTQDLSDIDLYSINKYVENPIMGKNACFLREKIIEMNYNPGSHSCIPVGNLKYSEKTYNLKHMNKLGLLYIINKMIKRYERNELMRSKGLNIHYSNDIEKIKKDYDDLLLNCKLLAQ
jgi:glycosyltransferase involved in cell wall biosynthesis